MEVARITALVTANTTGFLRGMAQVDAGVKRASAQMGGLAATTNRLGTRMASLGATMTKRVSLPAIAVGAASVAMAAEFETSIAKIQGLVGVAAADVQKLAATAQEVGPAYGKSATEAADALFYITSAGIKASEAGSVLEASAKASAVGLGDTATIADLATSAMNAYGSSVLPASSATDVMVAAVREGKLEASELAGSMGRVLPVASAMGVSFNEVGAAFAALSRTGTNAAEAATQIRGILASVLRPTRMAQETLAEYGMSAGDLRKQIREKGLLSVLKTLTSTFGDNEEAQARVFGNIRALSGVLDLMGKNVKGTEQIFKKMEVTTGDLDAAFAVTSQTAAFKMSVAMEQIKTSLLGLGQAIAPVVAGLASFIGGIGSAFGKLPGPVKTVAGALLGIVAVMGPLMLGVGKLTAMMTANAAATTAAGAAATRTAVQMSLLGTAAGGTAGKVGMFSKMAGMMGGPIGMAIGATVGLAAVMWNLRNPLSAVERQNAALAEAQQQVTDNQKAQAQAFTSSGQTVRSISAATKDVSAKSKELTAAQKTLTALQSSGKATAEQLAKAERDVAVARAEVGVATAQQNALAGQSAQSVRDLMKAENDGTRALEEQRDALRKQTTGLAAHAAGTEEVAKRKRDLELVEADLALRQAEQPARLEKIRKHLVSQRDALKASGSQTDATKAAIDSFNREIHRLDQQTKNAKTVKVKANTANAATAISVIKTGLQNLDGKVISVTLKALKQGFNFGGIVPGFASGGTVRGPSGRDVIPAMLTAGEAVLTEKQQRLVNSGMTIGQAFRATGVPGFAKGKAPKKKLTAEERKALAKKRRDDARSRFQTAGSDLLGAMKSDLSGRLSAKFSGGFTGAGGTGFTIGKMEELRRAQEANLKSLEASFGMDALQKSIADAMKAFDKATAGELKAFEKKSATSMAAFEKNASDAIDAVNKKFDQQRKTIEATFDALTPAEQALKAFDERMQATDIATGISDAQKALEDARAFGSAKQIQDAQRALDSALLAQERADLEDRAEQSRTQAEVRREEALALLAQQQEDELATTKAHHDALIATEQDRIDSARELLEADIENRRATTEAAYAAEVATKQAQIDAALQTQRDADAAQMAQLQYQQQQESMMLDRRFARMEGHFNGIGNMSLRQTNMMINRLRRKQVDFENTGHLLIASIARGVSKAAPGLGKAAAKIAAVLEDYLRLRSPAKKGPLSDINHWFDGLAPSIASGIDTGAIENELNGMRPGSRRAGRSGATATINLNVSDQTFAGMSREQADRVAREIQSAIDRQVRFTI